MAFPRKKLLVLDVNGLLVDTYYQNEKRPTKAMPNAKVGNFYVYKRPCCDEFLQFCLENFVVGVWSSAREYNVNNLVEYIFGALKQKLAFSWHQSDCTDSGLRAPENKHKPLFLKELSKLWGKAKSDLPWNEGEYGPSNTLLVDDTPYKAILNPPNTGIFPSSYTVCNSGDDFLGCELRNYLKGICDTENVQIYVGNNPLGQPSIDSASPYWSYLSELILTVNFVASKVGDGIDKALNNFETNDTLELTKSVSDSSLDHLRLLLDDTKSSGPIITYERFGEIAEVAVDHPSNDDRNKFQEACGNLDSLEKNPYSSTKVKKNSCLIRKFDERDDCKQRHKDNDNKEQGFDDVDVCSAKEPVPHDTKLPKPHDNCKLGQEILDVAGQTRDYLLDNDKNKFSEGALQCADYVKSGLKYDVGWYQPKRKIDSAIDNQQTNGRPDSSSSSSKRRNKCFPLGVINDVDDCQQMHEEKNYGREGHIYMDVSSERVERRCTTQWYDRKLSEAHDTCKLIQEIPDVASQTRHYLLDDDKKKFSKGTLEPVDYVKPCSKYDVGCYWPKRRRDSAIEERNGILDSSSSKRHRKFFMQGGINEVDNYKQMHEEKNYDREEHNIAVSSERVESRCTQWQTCRSAERQFGCSNARSNESLQRPRIFGHIEEHKVANTRRSGLDERSLNGNGKGFFQAKLERKSWNDRKSRQTFKEDRPMEQFDVERNSSISRDRLVGLQSQYTHRQSDVWDRIGEQANVRFAHTSLDNPGIRGSRNSYVQRGYPNGFHSERRFHSHTLGNDLNCLRSDEPCHIQREKHRHTHNFWGNKWHQGSNVIGASMQNEDFNGQLTESRGLISSHKVDSVVDFTKSDYQLHSGLVEHPQDRWNNQSAFHNYRRMRAETDGDDGGVDQEHGAFFESEWKWKGHGQQTNQRGFCNYRRMSAETYGDDDGVEQEYGASVQFFENEWQWQGHGQNTYQRPRI